MWLGHGRAASLSLPAADRGMRPKRPLAEKGHVGTDEISRIPRIPARPCKYHFGSALSAAAKMRILIAMTHAHAAPAVLTRSQVDEFIVDGLTMLRGAFPRDVALACQRHVWDRLGLSPDQPATWIRDYI